jgi:hypothetical protein
MNTKTETFEKDKGAIKVENLTLREWLKNTGASWYNSYLEKWLDLQVTREFSSVFFDQDEWSKFVNLYFPNHGYVYSFITLENGWAVGWNENPARGWSFPKSIKKYDYPKKK